MFHPVKRIERQATYQLGENSFKAHVQEKTEKGVTAQISARYGWMENGRAMMEVFQFLINLRMQLSYSPASVLLDMYRTKM